MNKQEVLGGEETRRCGGIYTLRAHGAAANGSWNIWKNPLYLLNVGTQPWGWIHHLQQPRVKATHLSHHLLPNTDVKAVIYTGACSGVSKSCGKPRPLKKTQVSPQGTCSLASLCE